MKEGKYYILKRNLNDEIVAERVSGYLITHEPSGLSFGCSYNEGYWDITELSTGLRITTRTGTLRTVNNKDMIEPYIDKFANLVKNVVVSHPEFIDRFNNIVGGRGKKRLW